MTGAVMTFYRFVDLDDPATLAVALERQARRLDLRGTVLLAGEGINGTVTGTRDALHAFARHLRAQPPLVGLACRFSRAAPDNPVFHRLKVRVKAEIVRLDQPGVRPARRTGERVDAARWNGLLEDPDVVVVDVRNRYEVEIGTFPGARSPDTGSFRELPRWVAANLNPERHPRLAMFCTGGIRCEKASAWLLEQGFEAVYQLDGGILRYLETVAGDDNRWQGECFVFDQRVSVDATLEEGAFEQCFACRRPLSESELTSADYRPGICCPHCVADQTPAQRQAFVERWHQETLARQRGSRHVGAAPPNRFTPQA